MRAVKCEAWKKIKASWKLLEIVDLMMEHRGAAEVQQAGCEALQNLFTSADCFFVQADAVLVHAFATEVPQAGCRSLLHL